jgi:hypothetical protein
MPDKQVSDGQECPSKAFCVLTVTATIRVYRFSSLARFASMLLNAVLAAYVKYPTLVCRGFVKGSR